MNLASIIEPHPPEAVAVVTRGHAVTYGELAAQVAGLRGGLVGLGLQPGDRIGLLCANNLLFVVSYLAALGAGLVVVPLNPASPAPELTHELAVVGARAVVVGPVAKPVWARVERSDVPAVEYVIAADGADEPVGVSSFDALLESEPVPIVERQPDDLAVLMFTSGTAGAAKAAMLSHGNLLANLEQVGQHEGRRVESDDVLLAVLPLFHIFGLNVVLGTALHRGASVVLVERFDPSTALETIRDRGVTVVSGAPPMWSAWATLPDVDPSAFAKVRLALTGASKMPEDIARLFESRFHLELLEGYGLTEASPVVTSSVGGEARPGSIGLPVSGVQVRLVDKDGEDVLAGDAGEIWVKGPNVFQGYWEDPDATAKSLTPDGWLRTGDIAVTDDDGHLYLVDRAKDLIIVSGFNVYPGEVEQAIASMPGVVEVAVVGVPHPHTGEAVKAYVVTAAGVALDEDAIIDHCRGQLARYKCPSKILFVDELPKGLAGKVLRRVLR